MLCCKQFGLTKSLVRAWLRVLGFGCVAAILSFRLTSWHNFMIRSKAALANK